MSTSGVYQYTLNTQQLINATFRMMGVYSDDSPPPPTDVSNAQQTLNLMLRQWISKGVPLFHITDITITPVASQSAYTIGPSGNVSGVSFRPIKMLIGRLFDNTVTPPLSVPLLPLSRRDYDMLGQQGASGPPNSWYYDPQLGNGILYLYLTPDATAASDNTVVMTCQRPMQAQINLTDNFDFADEWINPIKMCLADELLEDFEVPPQKAARIRQRAQAYREEAFNASVEEASTRFSPDYTQGQSGFRGRG